MAAWAEFPTLSPARAMWNNTTPPMAGRERESMVNNQTEYALFIALAIEKNLEEIRLGSKESTFVDHASEYAPSLEDAANIKDVSLNSAWNFADQFFFSYAHNDSKMAGIEWSNAFDLLRDIIMKLKSGEAIKDANILMFQHPVPKPKR